MKLNTSYPEDVNTLYRRYSMRIFWKISNVVPTPRNPSKKSPIRRIQLLDAHAFICEPIIQLGSSEADQVDLSLDSSPYIDLYIYKS
ncbi:hypothetical protein Tco_0900842 [Tanacetum coccineum]